MPTITRRIAPSGVSGPRAALGSVLVAAAPAAPVVVEPEMESLTQPETASQMMGRTVQAPDRVNQRPVCDMREPPVCRSPGRGAAIERLLPDAQLPAQLVGVDRDARW